MALDYNDKSVEIQGWLIGYKEYGAWRTINLPGEKFLSEAIIEKILSNLNKKSDIVYSRKKMGIYESNNHNTKKGEFIGLYI